VAFRDGAGGLTVEIIDGQLHEPSLWRDWQPSDVALRHEVTTEALFSTIDSVGVDGAVLMPADIPWAEKVAAEFPQRFVVVPRLNPGVAGAPGGFDLSLNPDAPDIAEQIVATFARPGIAGIRFSIGFWPEVVERWHAGAFVRALDACGRNRIPIFMFVSGHMDIVPPVAEAYPEMTIIVDHLGIKQPPLEELDTPPWRRLPELLALAKYENIAIKMCGAQSLSTQGYPFSDAWPAVEQILETFGVERLFWGSDISRFRGRVGTHSLPKGEGPYGGKHTYAESLAFIKESNLSEEEKRLLLGGTIRKLLDWPVAG
jgi:L-fuconolactonase